MHGQPGCMHGQLTLVVALRAYGDVDRLELDERTEATAIRRLELHVRVVHRIRLAHADRIGEAERRQAHLQLSRARV
eukprot:6214386-Pleurochrysis_carterae.AAC.3